MDTENKKIFLLINDTHYSWNPVTTAINKLTEEEFFSQYNKESDTLSLLAHNCQACPKKEAEKLGADGVPKIFESEQDYLSYIYSESDPHKRIAAKAVFDKKFRS